MGSVAQPSGKISVKERTLRIKGLPDDFVSEELSDIASHYGVVEKCFLNDDKTAVVTFSSQQSAKEALAKLNSLEIRNSKLQAEIVFSMKTNGPSNKFSTLQNNRNKTNCPVKILVASELVGAIIGKKGATIKNITTQHKARVDVHGKENSGLAEKIISIYGQPDNCSNALREILKVVESESVDHEHGTLLLKMLVEDRYCGRIIGKEGKIIKKLKEETDTKISVSNMQDMMSIYPDRVIAIRGAIDNIIRAQSSISQKLNEFMERDVASNALLCNMAVPGGIVPNSLRRPLGSDFVNNLQGDQRSVQSEMCQIIVPNSIVGSIIGTGGSIIKQIMQDSNAHVVVEPKNEKDENMERIVTIKGTADACWKASYFIFEKVKGEGMVGSDDRLKTGLMVPAALIGRVIGKNGKNVREVQRMTGATIKLCDNQKDQSDEVLVEVFGNFMATQGAHNRIRALISQPVQGPPRTQRGDRNNV